MTRIVDSIGEIKHELMDIVIEYFALSEWVSNLKLHLKHTVYDMVAIESQARIIFFS